MTLLKDNNYKEINVALLSLEADIKNKITNFDTSEIDKQLAEINSRIDKINTSGGNNSSDEIEDINSKLNSNSNKIRNLEQNIGDIDTRINGIEQKLSDIFSAENKVTDFNTTTNAGIYYWLDDAANKPGTDYGVLLVNKYDRGDNNSIWVNQIAYGTNNKIYFRQNINSGNWTEWKAVAFDGELNADTVDNYNASQFWRSDGETWNPGANVVMTTSGNGSEWSFDFRNKNGATGTYWQVWDENKATLLQVNADDGKVSAPYGFVGNLSGKADTAGTADKAVNLTAGAALNGNNKITTTNPTKIGAGQIKVHTVYGGDGPATYGNLINIGGNGGFQFFVEWTGSQTEAGQDLIGRIFTRFWRDNQSAWTAWKELAYNTADVTFNAAKASSKMVIPIGAPSSLEDGCIWIER